MHDDLDLSVIERHHAADPRYREALRQHVAAIIDAADVTTAEAAPDLALIDLVTQGPAMGQRQRRRWVAGAAALVSAAAMILALVVVAGKDDPVAPAVQSPPATTAVVVDETVPATDPPDAATDTPQLFVEIDPGAIVDLPDAPIANLVHTDGVWTGTEMIVWGGFGADLQRSAVGAAFNLANGSWRVLAPAPIVGRSEAAMVWTGTEMLVWGGYIGNDMSIDDGAAYNPVTDTWRLLPSAPMTSTGGRVTSMIWTGDEAIIVNTAAAAYSPVTDTWRRLANPPFFGYPSVAGDSIIVVDGASMMRYDPTEDSWSVSNIGAQAEVVAEPGRNAQIMVLPSATGAPVELLDTDGNQVGELPAFPGDPDLFGDSIGASGWWVGDEVVFWIWTGEFPYEHEQMWTLNLTTKTWRQLDDTPIIEPAVVAAGDVLLAWGGIGPDGAPIDAAGVAYRAGITPSD